VRAWLPSLQAEYEPKLPTQLVPQSPHFQHRVCGQGAPPFAASCVITYFRIRLPFWHVVHASKYPTQFVPQAWDSLAESAVAQAAPPFAAGVLTLGESGVVAGCPFCCWVGLGVTR
jgi:hypothetical protein